jgi:hypothetical protein
LGWKTRSLDAGMRETLDWVAQNSPSEPIIPLNDQQKQVAKVALAAAAFLFILWLLGRKRGGDE